MKTVKTAINLDLSKYVDIETGQPMLDQLDKDTSIKVLKDSDLVVIDSKNFFITDVGVLTQLLQDKIISVTDVGYIMMMSQTLKTEHNATFNYSVPHTLESLSKLLDLSYERTTKLIRKLYSKNIMYKLTTVNATLYCMNPYLTRKRKTLSKELIAIFSQFDKESKKTKKVKK
jgi:hypothetical protein